LTEEKTPFSNLLEKAAEIASLDYRDLASHLPSGREPVGFFCPFVPEELLQAAGALPFRLMDVPVKISHAQAHLPAYCCHLVKSSLESYLRGELDFLKGIVFSQGCDSMKGLADIWALQERLPFQHNLMVPTRLDSPLARDYFMTEMTCLKEALEKRLGRISPEELARSIRLFNRLREQLGKIYTRRRLDPARLSGGQLAQIVRAGYLMDRETYLDLLTGILEAWPDDFEKESSQVPLFLSGNMVHSSDWFSLIEESGARIVRDDLCSGARVLRLSLPEEGDPLEALVDRYFRSYLCPTKHQGIMAHQEVFFKELEQSGAKGVLFLFYKYCEPYYFDYPDLKKSLEDRGYPTLLLEIEDPSQAREQMKIRLQAFVEMMT
jgi:benzoyl-CoA reductase/2-hydroxyglutaryl-CoA dehydratase subunit BcrC/BadD/HgdB